MKAVSNLFFSSTKNNNNRRSTPATMYDLIDNGYDISTTAAAAAAMNFNNDADYTDGFWKVFMLNDKPGKTTRCCERSSSFNTQGCQDSKMTSADVVEQGCGMGTCYCMKHSKTARRRRFKSQSGYYLAIMPNGQIMGVKDKNSPYSEFLYLFLIYFNLLV